MASSKSALSVSERKKVSDTVSDILAAMVVCDSRGVYCDRIPQQIARLGRLCGASTREGPPIRAGNQTLRAGSPGAIKAWGNALKECEQQCADYYRGRVHPPRSFCQRCKTWTVRLPKQVPREIPKGAASYLAMIASHRSFEFSQEIGMCSIRCGAAQENDFCQDRTCCSVASEYCSLRLSDRHHSHSVLSQ